MRKSQVCNPEPQKSKSEWSQFRLSLGDTLSQKQTKPRRMGEMAQQGKALTAPNLSLILGTPVVEGGANA